MNASASGAFYARTTVLPLPPSLSRSQLTYPLQVLELFDAICTFFSFAFFCVSFFFTLCLSRSLWHFSGARFVFHGPFLEFFGRQRRIFFDNDSYLFGILINETWWSFILMVCVASLWHRCANALIYWWYCRCRCCACQNKNNSILFCSLCPHLPVRSPLSSEFPFNMQCDRIYVVPPKQYVCESAFFALFCSHFSCVCRFIFVYCISLYICISSIVMLSHQYAANNCTLRQRARELSIALFSYFYCSSLYYFD